MRVLAPLYAAKYLKESLGCLDLARPEKAVQNFLAAQYEDDDFVKGVKQIKKGDVCAYAPQLSPNLAWVHSDLVTKKSLRKASSSPIHAWWNRFSRADRE